MQGLRLLDSVQQWTLLLWLTRSMCYADNNAAMVRSLLAAHDGSPTISVVVEFDNDDVAVDEQSILLSNIAHYYVHTVQPKGRFVAMDVDVLFLDSIVDDLSTNPHFVGIETDSVWEEQGVFVEDLFFAGSHVRRRHRQLQEIGGYGVAMIQAYQVSVGSSPTAVCVVDTGVAGGHPDLDFTRINGADRVSNLDKSLLEWDKDTRGHGTHTIGIITAVADNGVGIKGVGKIPVYVTRGLNNEGKAMESDIVDALDQCEAANAKIISLSLAGPSMNSQTREKIRSLYEEKGFLILAASGNQGGRNQVFPASDPFVISVTAVTESRSRWYGSNYGPWVELAGPGALIRSTSVQAGTGQPTYSVLSGTSMATPFVAAAAALLWSNFPTCTNTQIRYALAYTASKSTTTNAECTESEGYGVVQTKDAYDFLATHPCVGANWGQKVSSDGMCNSIDVQPVATPTITNGSSSTSTWANLLASWLRLGW
jgi:subtilisin family serine protease